jgi:2-isopropylmalate synthase
VTAVRIQVLDTTLSEMAMSFNIRITPNDRLRILRKLEDLMSDYIEVDAETYIALGGYAPRETRLSVFVRRAEDLPATASVVSFSTDFMLPHKEPALGQIRLMVSEGRTVLLIAENFFDAFGCNPQHAVNGLLAAREAGALALILDDTRGGVLPSRVASVCRAVTERVGGALGIRARNDCGLAVANTLTAVESGFHWVAGAVNGYGERCGAANLCTVLANLELKLGQETVGRDALTHLSAIAHFVSDAANQPLPENTPFAGSLAFGHPMPASAGSVLESLASVPHVDPESVGHAMSILPGDSSETGMSSWSNSESYELELADGTVELLRRQAQQPDFRGFEVQSWEVSTRQTASGHALSSAAVTILARNNVYTGSATSDGPVHAMDLALLECLMPLYPALARVRLSDYRVRVLQPRRGTASIGRVLIEWTDGESTWHTAGLSSNLLEASWDALVDGMRLELMRLVETQTVMPEAEVDSSWAV